MAEKMTPLEIQYELKKAGYSQADIADICEVSAPMVSRVIAGAVVSHRVRKEIAQRIKRKVNEIWDVPADPSKPGPRSS